MTRIVLAGYIGYGNCGDEAMVAGTIRWLRTHLAQPEITVLSANPAQTAAEHGVTSLAALPTSGALVAKTLGRPARWKTVQAVRQADLVIWLAGSGIFSDTRGPTIASFWPLFHLLRRLARKLIFLSASVGPVEFPQSREIIARIAREADAIGVRDPDSGRLLQSLVGEDPFVGRKILPMADMALSLEPASEPRLDTLWRAEGLDRNMDCVAFAPITFFQTPAEVPRTEEYREQFIRAAAEALDELARTESLTPVLVPFQQGHDPAICRAIAARMKTKAFTLRGGYHPAEMLGLLGWMRVVVGMRLHSLILAAMAMTPAVALIYDEKVKAFLEDLGLAPLGIEYYAWRRERDPLDAGRLAALARGALRHTPQLRQQLWERTFQMKERNRQGADRLKRMGIL